MSIAELVAQRSRCERRYGAVLVDGDGRVISTGYNGPPPGFKHDDRAVFCRLYCAHARERTDTYADCPANHAEANALLWSDAVRRGDTSTLYVSSSSCMNCAKLIAGARVARVVWGDWEMHRHPSPEEVKRYLEEDCRVTVNVLR